MARHRRAPAYLDVVEATLGNGLKLRMVPSPNVPTACLYTYFKVGSRNERPGITGISHLFEHMFFNGAKKYGPGEFDRILENNAGESNAYTTPDITVYHETFAAEALPTVLDLESDRMRSLRISPAVLEREREVVKEERRLRVDNEIPGIMAEELESLVFKAHPYRWPVIGWMGDIEAISKQDCDAYFSTYYAPNNATLYLAGDFDPRQALQLVKRSYGNIPKGPTPPAVLDAEPDQRGERRAEVRHPAQAPSLMIGYRGPAASSDQTLVLDVIQYALSIGEAGRLVKELVYKQEKVVDVSMDWSWRLDPGLLVFFLELKPGSDPADAERAFYQQLDRVAQEGLPERELQRAKNNLKAHVLDELSTNASRASALGNWEVFLGGWERGFELAERYASVTSEQCKAAAALYFDPKRRSVVALVPEAPQGEAR